MARAKKVNTISKACDKLMRGVTLKQRVKTHKKNVSFKKNNFKPCKLYVKNEVECATNIPIVKNNIGISQKLQQLEYFSRKLQDSFYNEDGEEVDPRFYTAIISFDNKLRKDLLKDEEKYMLNIARGKIVSEMIASEKIKLECLSAVHRYYLTLYRNYLLEK